MFYIRPFLGKSRRMNWRKVVLPLWEGSGKFGSPSDVIIPGSKLEINLPVTSMPENLLYSIDENKAENKGAR